jgi:hypothetical protein
MSRETLVEFLLARIAEDEAVAEASPTQRWRYDGGAPLGHWARGAGAAAMVMTEWANGHSTFVVQVPSGGGGRPGVEPHIARHDPVRVLAECAAKRRIVDDAAAIEGIASGASSPKFADGAHFAMQDVLLYLAQPYADHPDFREEWARPGLAS